MGVTRYVFQVRGAASDAVLIALREGPQAEADSASTAVQRWLPATQCSQIPGSCRPAA